jgi:hypothetical protein
VPSRDLPFDYTEFISKHVTAMYIKIVHLGWRLWMLFLILLLTGSAGTMIY